MILRTVLFYVLTWFFLILLGGFQQETGLLPAEIGIAQWGPGLAGLLMTLLFRKDGLRITFRDPATTLRRYLLAALIPIGAALVILVAVRLLPPPSGPAPAAYDSLLLVLLWAPFGALGEEIGWRGYLNKALDTRLRGLVSAVLVGLLWMPIHIHFLSQGPLFIFFLTVLIVSYSIVLYALVHDTRFSVLLATVFHLAVNYTNLLFLDVIYDVRFMAANALVWALIAIVTVWRQRAVFLEPKARPAQVQPEAVR